MSFTRAFILAFAMSMGFAESMAFAKEARTLPVFRGVTLTAYSARCAADGAGGPNTSTSSLPPRSYTLESQRTAFVMLAATQFGGTSSLYGCEVEFDFSQSDVPAAIRTSFQGKRSFVADRLDTSSNGMSKLDVSVECSPSKMRTFKYRGVIAKATRCKGVIEEARNSPRGQPVREARLLPSAPPNSRQPIAEDTSATR